MKCVMVINQDLPLGLIANTAAVLAVSIGSRVHDIVGADVFDQDGQIHPGITQATISLLRGDSELIRHIRARVLEQPDETIFFVDFCDVAQRSKHYDDYRAQLAQAPESALSYLGIALYGPPQQINRITGQLGLLR